MPNPINLTSLTSKPPVQNAETSREENNSGCQDDAGMSLGVVLHGEVDEVSCILPIEQNECYLPYSPNSRLLKAMSDPQGTSMTDS
jgi:hypothetical protein